jgi:glycine/D-amino acid oxidase-like deaminating enzyme
MSRGTVSSRGSAAAERQPSEPLPGHASVTIIGGGVVGVSTAFHLARGGVQSILVIERDLLGSGSSAKPLGGVRATFSDPGNMVLAQRSLEAYERFGAEFGVDIGLRQVGYLFLCRTENELAAVESSTKLQNVLGGSSEMVSAGRAAQLNPFIDPQVLLGASFSPRDGYAQPAEVVRGYTDAARSLGVVFREQTDVIGIDSDGGRVTAVRTSRGVVRTDTVICTAGAWSQRIGEMAGVMLPVVPVRRQIGFTGPLMDPMPILPFTLDLGSTLYFHNAGTGLLLGISDAGRPASWLRTGVLLRVAGGLRHSRSRRCPVACGPAARGRLGRTLREHSRSQRLDRQSEGSGELPVCDGVLRTRLSAGARSRRASGRLVSGSRLVSGPAPVPGGPISRRGSAERDPHHLVPPVTGPRSHSLPRELCG